MRKMTAAIGGPPGRRASTGAIRSSRAAPVALRYRSESTICPVRVAWATRADARGPATPAAVAGTFITVRPPG